MDAQFSHHEALIRLNEIGIALSCEQDLNKLLDKILTEARTLVHAQGGSLYLRQDDSLIFVIFQNDAFAQPPAGKNADSNLRNLKIPLTTKSMAGYVGVTGDIINIDDVYNLPPNSPYSFDSTFDRKNNYRSRSMLVVPMRDPGGAIIGVFQLINALDAAGSVISFDPQYESLCLSLASQAAVSVRNATFTEKLKQAYLDTIFRLALTVEYRDEDTAKHLHRISNYTAIIAEELGMPAEQVQNLRYASPMHDIGKICVPDAILLKPGKLTASEFEEIKKHTVIGAKILSQSESEILKISEEIALSHHEKFNGKGYPHGLKGNLAPRSSQIVAVADVFDALTSKRCYKKAIAIDQTLDIMRNERGKHFQPDCLDAFFARIDDILLIKNQSTTNLTD